MNNSLKKFPRRFLVAIATLSALFLSHHAKAQALYWDPTGSATETGTWNTSASPANWNPASDGSGVNTLWTNGDDAYFSIVGETTAPVTMGSAVSVNSLNFVVGATTITTGADAITVGAGGITVSSGATGSVDDAANTTGITTSVAQTWANNGAGTLVIGGGSIGGGMTINAGVTLTAGIIQIGNTGQNNGIGGTGSITVNGATLKGGGATASLAPHNIYLVSGTITQVNGKAWDNVTAFLDGSFSSGISNTSSLPMASLALDGAYTLTAISSSLMVVNVIKDGANGSQAFTLAGPGAVAVNGNSTYSGGTTIGTTSLLEIGAGSTGGDLLNGVGGGAGYAGGTIADAGTLEVNHSNSYTFNGTVTGAGGFSQGGGGTTFIGSGASMGYSGGTVISAGILSVGTLAIGGAPSSIGTSSSAAANLVFNGGGTLQYTGGAASTDRLFQINGASGFATLDASGSGPINFTNTASLVYGTSGKPENITLTGTNTGNNTLAAKIGGNAAGVVSFNKTGIGTWVLTGASSYGGTTAISGGTLIVSGSLSGTANANIGSGATLAGTGMITTPSGGAVTGSSGAILAPGLSTNGMSLNATSGASTLNLQAGSDLLLSINNSNAGTSGSAALADYSKLTLGTGVTPTLSGTISTTVGTVNNGDLLTVILSGVAATTQFSNTTLVSGNVYSFTSGGQSWYINYAYNPATSGLTASGISLSTFEADSGGNDVALLVAVPEPGTWATLLGGMGMLIAFQKVRRRRG